MDKSFKELQEIERKINPKGLRSKDLTDEQIKMAQQNQKCPVSGYPMTLLKSQSTGKNELYCAESHVSVPLW